MYSLQFFKKFSPPHIWRPFWIFAQNGKHKFALTVQNRVISLKFSTRWVSKKCGYLRNVLFAIFKKFSPPHIWRPFWIFAQNGKHKFALTVQNRVISLKFSTHRVSKKCTLGHFQKIFLFPKMAAILNFQIFAKNRKTGICFYLLNRAR